MFPVFLLRFHFVSNRKITSNIEFTRTAGCNANVCAKTKSATAAGLRHFWLLSQRNATQPCRRNDLGNIFFFNRSIMEDTVGTHSNDPSSTRFTSSIDFRQEIDHHLLLRYTQEGGGAHCRLESTRTDLVSPNDRT